MVCFAESLMLNAACGMTERQSQAKRYKFGILFQIFRNNIPNLHRSANHTLAFTSCEQIWNTIPYFSEYYSKFAPLKYIPLRFNDEKRCSSLQICTRNAMVRCLTPCGGGRQDLPEPAAKAPPWRVPARYRSCGLLSHRNKAAHNPGCSACRKHTVFPRG